MRGRRWEKLASAGHAGQIGICSVSWVDTPTIGGQALPHRSHIAGPSSLTLVLRRGCDVAAPAGMSRGLDTPRNQDGRVDVPSDWRRWSRHYAVRQRVSARWRWHPRTAPLGLGRPSNLKMHLSLGFSLRPWIEHCYEKRCFELVFW